MPALVSHHLFADSALKQAQPYLANAAAAAPMAFRWGAQGPDLFFYGWYYIISPKFSFLSQTPYR